MLGLLKSLLPRKTRKPVRVIRAFHPRACTHGDFIKEPSLPQVVIPSRPAACGHGGIKNAQPPTLQIYDEQTKEHQIYKQYQ